MIYIGLILQKGHEKRSPMVYLAICATTHPQARKTSSEKSQQWLGCTRSSTRGQGLGGGCRSQEPPRRQESGVRRKSLEPGVYLTRKSGSCMEEKTLPWVSGTRSTTSTVLRAHTCRRVARDGGSLPLVHGCTVWYFYYVM